MEREEQPVSREEMLKQKWAEKLKGYNNVVFDKGQLILTEKGVEELKELSITGTEGEKWDSFTYSDEMRNESGDEINEFCLRTAIRPETGEMFAVSESIGEPGFGTGVFLPEVD
jgi:hypothetical protein